MLALKLVYSSTHTVPPTPENDGFERVLPLLAALKAMGHPIEISDTSGRPDAERHTVYYREAVGATAGRYTFGGVIGDSARSIADRFGTDIPALLVSETGTTPSDVYPHITPNGTIKTIAPFLWTLTSER